MVLLTFRNIRVASGGKCFPRTEVLVSVGWHACLWNRSRATRRGVAKKGEAETSRRVSRGLTPPRLTVTALPVLWVPRSAGFVLGSSEKGRSKWYSLSNRYCPITVSLELKGAKSTVARLLGRGSSPPPPASNDYHYLAWLYFFRLLLTYSSVPVFKFQCSENNNLKHASFPKAIKYVSWVWGEVTLWFSVPSENTDLAH